MITGVRTPAFISPEGMITVPFHSKAVVVTGPSMGNEVVAFHLPERVLYSNTSLVKPGCRRCKTGSHALLGYRPGYTGLLVQPRRRRKHCCYRPRYLIYTFLLGVDYVHCHHQYCCIKYPFHECCTF